LIAYFIGNISAKKISKSIYERQSSSKPKVGRVVETRCSTNKVLIISGITPRSPVTDSHRNRPWARYMGHVYPPRLYQTRFF